MKIFSRNFVTFASLQIDSKKASSRHTGCLTKLDMILPVLIGSLTAEHKATYSLVFSDIK